MAYPKAMQDEIANLFANLGQTLDKTVQEVALSTGELVRGLRQDREELEKKKEKIAK